jgi:hypothetical protein
MWDSYLNFIRKLPCAICQDDTRTDPHHQRGSKTGGTSFKCHSIRALPLCRKHHSEVHDHGHETFELKYGVTQAEMIVDAVELAIYQGVITLNKELV